MSPLGHGIFHAHRIGQGDADFRAARLGNPAARLQLPPGYVIFLRTNQGEHVAFPAVFANQRGRQAQPPPGLNLRRNPKHRSGQQVNFVVNDQAPIARIENLEMRKLVLLVRPVGQDSVGGQRDRGNFFAFAGVFGDLVVGKIGLVEQFAAPLLDGRDARGENQRRALEQGHGRQSDNRLAGAARQDNDAAASADIAARIKDLGCLPLIIPDVKRASRVGHDPRAEPNGQQSALCVSGQVFRRIADADERLLEHPPKGRVHNKAGLVQRVAQELPHSGLPDQFFQEGPIRANQSQR